MTRVKKSLLQGVAMLSLCLAALAFADKAPAPPVTTTDKTSAVAYFAGGCFWCVESDFEKVHGVKQVISGYMGGHVENPEYKQVASGKSGHVESVAVHYNPQQVAYTTLLEAFWRQIDPTDDGGQFVDRGYQYSPIIFIANQQQRNWAQASMENQAASGRYDKPLKTQILAASKFWPAEDYHQDYYQRNPIRYKYYRYNSGRDDYLKRIWGDELDISQLRDSDFTHAQSTNTPGKKTYRKADDKTLKATLTALEYEVTQEEGTEAPFDNRYWDEKRAGIYVDIVSGEPLFSSKDKYDSKTGWPSFSQALEPQHIVEKKDNRLFFSRTELRSKYADSHLGHVFDDGPQPSGLRYCINSAALRFVPKESLQSQGYAEYLSTFE